MSYHSNSVLIARDNHNELRWIMLTGGLFNSHILVVLIVELENSKHVHFAASYLVLRLTFLSILCIYLYLRHNYAIFLPSLHKQHFAALRFVPRVFFLLPISIKTTPQLAATLTLDGCVERSGHLSNLRCLTLSVQTDITVCIDVFFLTEDSRLLLNSLAAESRIYNGIDLWGFILFWPPLMSQDKAIIYPIYGKKWSNMGIIFEAILRMKL